MEGTTEMSTVLNDFSAQALATAVEANLLEWFEYIGRAASVELYASPSVSWFVTGIPHPFLNGVFRTRLASGAVDEAIEQVLAHFKSRKMPFMWWTGPAAQPSDLGKDLGAHGLDYIERFPGMAADLLALNDGLPTPSELIIVPVGDEERLAQWVKAVRIGYQLPDSSESTLFDAFADLGFSLPLRSYVGLLNGQPVAASQVFLGAGVAGIYCVATVPQARRKGIGTAVTLAPLREAREMGYRISILHPSKMGAGVYRQLGFEDHSQLSCGIWMGERANSQ
jgi:GNAT superfamily N-acetyltransferase